MNLQQQRWLSPLRATARLALVAAWAAVVLSCDSPRPTGQAADPGGSATSDSLPAELASVPLAVVGTHTIDLGEYAAVLARMDRFERMRYQSEDRRKQLLEEMIDVQLLAEEARRRGLDEQPETQLMIWQSYREEVYEQLRQGLPGRESFSELEVSEFYRAHQEEFAVPQTVRLAQVVVQDRVLAEQVLRAARHCDPGCWADLVAKHSPRQSDSTLTEAEGAFSVPGDLGFFSVTPPASSSQVTVQGVPSAVVSAGQKIPEDGAVYGDLVAVGTDYHIVRRIAQQAARVRSLSEVEGQVRSRLLDERFESARKQLLARLEREVPVEVDEAVLARLAESMTQGQK